MQPLPIDEHVPAIVAAVKTGSCVVLRATTGAGKTTGVPPALLDAGLAGDKQILLLQPRRLAARAAAARMSYERGTRLGEKIGYEVRFDRRSGRATRILAVTDGVFVRMLADDPFLERVGIVLFDEFHERNLNSDLALAMVRRVQREVRPDLKIVVMSATLAAQPIAEYLDNCPIIESAGRLFPIEIQFAHQDSTNPIHIQAAVATANLLEQTTGDVLVFLPGVGEIRRTSEELASLAEQQNIAVMELYGDLPLERQQAVLAPANRRKVVLATNVAETSVTIEGITGVVDAGWARVLRRDKNLGINRLELERISQASAEQRAGRAGRTAPGVCLRLWTRPQHRHLQERDEPEIRRVDLTGPVLELLAWGERDPLALPWFEPPSREAVDHAQRLLRTLGAVDDRGITDIGRAMARLPVHPRIARLMIEGARLGHPNEAALVGAMLSERDVFERTTTRRQGGCDQGANRRLARQGSDSDVLDRLVALQSFEHHGQRDSEVGRINGGAARFVLRARDQLLRLLEEQGRATTNSSGNVSPKALELSIDADRAIEHAVAMAYLDRLARRREPGSRRGLMAGGRGVRLTEFSAVTHSELFVCVALDETGSTEANVRMASAVNFEWLPIDLLSDQVEIEFDANREKVVAFQRTRFGDLIIQEAATNIPSDADAAEILAREATARLELHNLIDEEGQQFLNRVQFLARFMPELNLPSWDDAIVTQLLRELCRGCRSFAELRRVPLAAILKSKLTGSQLAALSREAPEKTTVPSGSQITLLYQPNQPPVLAVRIQEVFGLRETPRVAGGRVPILLHLLAPNYRPQQVTADLASFWRTTYEQVRKELRRRYPRHAWPDDPLTATPERRPQRKR